MTRKKYLKEIDLVANTFTENKTVFLEESRCIMYFLSQWVDKQVGSDYKKVALKIWPIGKMAELNIKPFMIDDVSKVIVIEVEYDLRDYYAFNELESRHLEIIRLLKKSFAAIPSNVNIDRIKLLESLECIKENGFIYTRELGRWIPNPSKTVLAKMFVEFNAKEILFCLKLQNKDKTKEWHQVFSRFKPFEVARLYEFWKLEFQSDYRMVCKFKKHYESIEFDVDMNCKNN